MKVFGVEFAPLRAPLEKRLQTLCGTGVTLWFILGSTVSNLFSLYLLLCTRLWWVIALYFCWFYWDKDIHENGGRRCEWVRDWTFWKYVRDYYPVTLSKVPGLELDPKRNYLFTYFPHGYVGSGCFAAVSNNHSGWSQLFPHHSSYFATLKLNFMSLFHRELLLALSGISASAKSLNWMLGYPGGGKVAFLLPGGAAEASYCQPGKYELVLKKRKGFIRLSMQNGVSVIPTIGFGETDLYTVFDVTGKPILEKFVTKVKKLCGFAPLLANGRGFFQYNFGYLPRRKPVHILVGPEFKIEKNPHPSEKDISDVHERFCEHLNSFFEENKHKYLANADDIHLVYK